MSLNINYIIINWVHPFLLQTSVYQILHHCPSDLAYCTHRTSIHWLLSKRSLSKSTGRLYCRSYTMLRQPLTPWSSDLSIWMRPVGRMKRSPWWPPPRSVAPRTRPGSPWSPAGSALPLLWTLGAPGRWSSTTPWTWCTSGGSGRRSGARTCQRSQSLSAGTSWLNPPWTCFDGENRIRFWLVSHCSSCGASTYTKPLDGWSCHLWFIWLGRCGGHWLYV